MLLKPKCGNCRMYRQGRCGSIGTFGLKKVKAQDFCDIWEPRCKVSENFLISADFLEEQGEEGRAMRLRQVVQLRPTIQK